MVFTLSTSGLKSFSDVTPDRQFCDGFDGINPSRFPTVFQPQHLERNVRLTEDLFHQHYHDAYPILQQQIGASHSQNNVGSHSLRVLSTRVVKVEHWEMQELKLRPAKTDIGQI